MMPFAIQVAQFQLVILAQFKLVTYTGPGLGGLRVYPAVSRRSWG